MIDVQNSSYNLLTSMENRTNLPSPSDEVFTEYPPYSRLQPI
jgi:hypothetical protein